MRKFVFAFVFLTASLPTFAQARTAPADPGKSIHTGNWWLSKSDTYREAFVNGYKSGWHHALGHNSPLNPFSASTVAEGVDKFYSKFENRLIPVDEAIGFVSEQLNGVAPDRLNAEILSLRATAAHANTAPDPTE